MFMGMNRFCLVQCIFSSGVPHVHGDEPKTKEGMRRPNAEFPMFMGMNRTQRSDSSQRPRVPHVHGDEPVIEYTEDGKKVSSPCSWG